MPIQSRKIASIPEVSVPSWVFGSPTEPLSDTPIIFDAQFPQVYSLSLSSYRSWSQRFAAGLRNHGFNIGDTLLLVSGNTLAYPVALMGTLMAGGVISGANPLLNSPSLINQVKQLTPHLILSSREGLDNVRHAATAAGINQDRIYQFDHDCIFTDVSKRPSTPAQDSQHWRHLIDLAGDAFDWTLFASSSQLAAINYTSGSTGLPKGVMVTHRNFVANGVQFIAKHSDDPLAAENGYPVVWVTWTPMYHVIGETQYCMVAVKRGIRNYIMDRFDLGSYLEYIQRYKATDIIILPPILIAMLHHPATRQKDLSSLKIIHVGGSPIRESTSESLRALMPNKFIIIRQAWGMSEITAVVISPDPTDNQNSSTVGELLPNCEAKVMAPDGSRELGENKDGELWIRSPNVAQGYFLEPRLTAQTFLPDGWLRTGDLGHYDAKLNWYVKDRIQDVMFAENGEYVLPTDLESALLSIPGVKDAGITSISSPFNPAISLPRAFIVIGIESKATKNQITDAFHAKMTQPQEKLEGGVFEVEEIPRLPSGKVNRPALRSFSVD